MAERELTLPRSLTMRLANLARSHDVTEGNVADWMVEQLREPARRVEDRIDKLSGAPSTSRFLELIRLGYWHLSHPP